MGLRPTQGDEKRLLSATALHGVALPFVIPPVPAHRGSAAEGSAVPRTLLGNVFDRAKRSGGICGFHVLTTNH
jgi:hypothetical protein